MILGQFSWLPCRCSSCSATPRSNSGLHSVLPCFLTLADGLVGWRQTLDWAAASNSFGISEGVFQRSRQVRNASLFAQEVQTDAFAAIDRMQARISGNIFSNVWLFVCAEQDEVKANAEVADTMAQSRSRLKISQHTMETHGDT